MSHRAVCCWCQAPLVKSGAIWWCGNPVTDACRLRQSRHAQYTLDAKGQLKEWLYVPLPKQTVWHEAVYTPTTTRILIGGAAGPGKPVSLDTPIPTPRGSVAMGDLLIGSTVFADTGQPCTVIGKSDVHIDPRGTYRVTFDDGSQIVAGGGHEWRTWTDKERRQLMSRSPEWRARRRSLRAARGTGARPWLCERNTLLAASYQPQAVTGSIRTTEAIAATLHVRDGSRTNHAVRLGGAWQMDTRRLPLDPYVLGVWLGDGHTAGARITSADPEIMAEVNAAGFPTTPQGNYLWRCDGLREGLQAAGVWKSGKRVPDAYLSASAPQRLALLQGLMDTDGSCDGDRSSVFTNTNEGLARSAYTLAASLGLKPHWKEDRATLYGKDCGPNYEVRWTHTLPVFRLPRKRDRLPTTLRTTQGYRYIVGCERIPDVPVQCIEVDSPSHQYLCGTAGIPTHNSTCIRRILYEFAKIVPGFHAIILRQSIPDLKKSHLRFLPYEVAQLGGLWKEGDKIAVFKHPGGMDAIIRAGHFEDASAIQDHLSAEYDVVAPDEVVTLEQDPTLELFSRARTTNPVMFQLRGLPSDDPEQVLDGSFVLAGSNPGGRLWVKDHWITKAPDPEEFPNYNPARWAFYDAKLADNPYIKGGYVQNLRDLREVRRRQLEDGDWDCFDGALFADFAKSRHVGTFEELYAVA